MYNPSSDTENVFSTNGHGSNGASHKIISMEHKLRSPEFLREFELDLPDVDHRRIENATRDILEASAGTANPAAVRPVVGSW